jgi:hypothetical protein
MNRGKRKQRYFKMLKLKFMLDDLRKLIDDILVNNIAQMASDTSPEVRQEIVAAAKKELPWLNGAGK